MWLMLRGYVAIRTVESGVAVSAIYESTLNQFVIAFGVGKSLRHTKCKALSVFHAFIGCDQTSAFAGRGNKTACGAWLVCDCATPVFEALGQVPFRPSLYNMIPI